MSGVYLPVDVVVNILNEVDFFTLVSCLRVCKAWHQAISNNPQFFWYKNIQVLQRKTPRYLPYTKYQEQEKAYIHEILLPFEIILMEPLSEPYYGRCIKEKPSCRNNRRLYMRVD
eukprot:TRINITY_DN11312_c0_g1_i1.p1 TRINITY_DN11312_c0_g1~~TRINITY_DN11312_c0_g1_i1.p1  ORF type:complete len:115 (+),score=32.16 TRINITY_DN11312_c0_g1_i1:18-362(+)